MPHSYSKSYIISLSWIEWATSIFQKSCFLLCLKPNYIIHTSHSLIFPHLDPSPTFSFSFSFLWFFFFGLWIQLQVTHLALSSLFGLKHRLFMNFARLVHILCSIRLYENGLTNKFKHKNLCPIYYASPSCFGKFLFLWKTCLNLYLKWAMTIRSPHFSFFLNFFFREKKVTKFYHNTSKSFTCPITNPILNVHSLPSWGFAPSFKSLIHFYLSFSNGPYPYLKGLSQLVQKDFTFNPHRVLGIPKAWIGSQLFNKVYNILMILGSLAFEKDF